MDDLKIIMNIFHNPVEELRDYIDFHNDLYFPINGGASLFPTDDPWIQQHIVPDNTDDNISSLNNKINEFTSMFWVWKDYDKLGDPKYIGFSHYRRFFTDDNIKNSDDNYDFFNYDFIVSKPVLCRGYSLIQQYQIYYNIKDLKILYDILCEIDREFGQRFLSYMSRFSSMYAPFNMFITKKLEYYKYCALAFRIISQLNERIDLTGRDTYQNRAICFLMERFTSFYLFDKRFRGYKIKEVDICQKLEWKDNKLNERQEFLK